MSGIYLEDTLCFWSHACPTLIFHYHIYQLHCFPWFPFVFVLPPLSLWPPYICYKPRHRVNTKTFQINLFPQLRTYFQIFIIKKDFSYQYLTGTSERLDVFIHVVEVIVDLLNLKFNMVQHGSTTKTLRYFERIDDTFQSLSINRKTVKWRN